jgi:enamine deaminase RidA (YjgF/YER057c/UK114 family)
MADGDAVRLFPGVPYSYSASTAGDTVFTAGACPLDADGKVVAEGDVAEQTRQTVTNLLRALSQAGCGPEDVVKNHDLRGDHQSIRPDRRVGCRGGGLRFERTPSTLVGVTVLGYSGQLVEIEAVAAGPRSGQRSLTS